MAAIQIVDLNNAKLDVDHLAAIVTSTSATATDRLGNTKSTLHAALAEFPLSTANAAAAAASAAAAQASAQDAAASEAAVADAIDGIAAIIATDPRSIFPTTAAGIGQGVQGTSSLVAGSGGTNGTFALAFSGGTQVIAPTGRFVVAGGAVTEVIIDYPGYYSAGTPTISLAASSGLTGASVAATMGPNTPVGAYFATTPALEPDLNSHDFWLVTAGPAAMYKASSPNAAEVRTLRDELSEVAQVIGYPTLPVANGTANLDSSHYVFNEPIAADGLLSGFAYYGGGTAGSVKVRSYSKSGNTFTVVSERLLTVSAGSQSAEVGIEVTAGQYLGFAASASGVLRYDSGTADSGGYFTAAGGYAGSTFDDAAASPTLRLNVRFEVTTLTRVGTLEDRVQDAEDDIALRVTKAEVYNTIERKTVIGLDGVLEEGTGGLDGSLYVLEQAAAVAGEITKFRIYSTGAGSVRVMVFSKSGDTFTVVDEQTVSVVEGHNGLDVSLDIASGQYVGAQGSLIGYLTGVSDASGWYGGTGTTSFTDSTVARHVRLLIGFDLAWEEEVLKGGGHPTLADLPFEHMLIIGAGQSLMEGSRTPSYPLDPITLEQEYDTLGFAAYNATPSALYPATVANTQRDHPTLDERGEWPGLGCAASIRQALLRDNNLAYTAVKSTIVVANTASDGQRIGLLGPGSVPYEAGIAKAAALGGLVTGSSGAAAVIWAQGESDGPIFNNTDPAVYLAALKQLAIDYDADLREATEQTKRVPLVSYQTGSTGRSIALAQLQASLESPLIYIACPMYQFDYYDNLHINPASSRLLGGYFGEAVKAIVIDGDEWEPLRPIAAQVLGNTITLTFNKSGLKLDTTLVPAQANHGFSVKNDSGTAITVSAVALKNSNQVRLTCASAPGTDWVVQYGNLTAAGKSPYTGGAGNLRDSRGDQITFDGSPLHNWCVLFDWTL